MKNLFLGLIIALSPLSTACSQTQPTQAVSVGKAPKTVKTQLNAVLATYYGVKDALVATNSQKAQTEAGKLMATLAKVEVATLTDEQQKFYAPLAEKLRADAQYISETTDVEKQRTRFEGVSNNLYVVITTFKANTATAYQQYCPMAFDDKGAFWLSDKKEVRNPYFGNKMLKCGSVKAEF